MATNTTTGMDDAETLTVRTTGRYQDAPGDGGDRVTFTAGWGAGETGLYGTTTDGASCFFPWTSVARVEGTLGG